MNDDLEQNTLLSHSSGGWKPILYPIGLHSGVVRAAFPSEDLRGEKKVFLLFPAFKLHLLPLAVAAISSSKPTTASHISLTLHLSREYSLLLPFLGTPIITLGPPG